MIRIPNIKIPSVRVGSISPTSNIGTGSAKPAPPTPITYLTQWQILGNSEVHGQEIWSCGEYSAVDGKWHILVQPQGGSIADIALNKPLRKVNDVADTVEFPSNTDGKALVTRNIISHFIGDCTIVAVTTNTANVYRWSIANDAKKIPSSSGIIHDVLSNKFSAKAANQTYVCIDGVSIDSLGSVLIYASEYTDRNDKDAFKTANADVEVIYEAEIPVTELVDAPQIEEADSYSCEISQGGKAVEWSSFETDSG